MAEIANSSDLTALTIMAAAMNKSENRWANRLNNSVAALTAGVTAYHLGKNLYRRITNRRLYDVVIPGNNDLYESMVDWLSHNTAIDERESLQATAGTYSVALHDAVADSGDRKIIKDNIRLQYAGDKEQEFQWKGNTYKILVERLGTGKELMVTRFNKMTISCTDIEARKDLVELLTHVDEERRKSPPRILVPRWGSWNAIQGKAVRSLDSVILQDGIKEHIVSDMQNFLGSEDKYIKLGIPYHRGYLFHGAPGTGKSSLVQALSAHFGLDVYYVPLADLHADLYDNLLQLVSSIPARGVLLLEDIDSLLNTHDRATTDGKTDNGPSLSTLLNTLDGPLTPHGLITAATTNRLQVLDEALIRSGRFDVSVEMANVTRDQVRGLFSMAYSTTEFDDAILEPKADVSPADVVDLFKTNFGEPHKAVEIYQERFAVGV